MSQGDGIRSFRPYDVDDDAPVKKHSYADRDRLMHLYGSPQWRKHTQPAVMRRDPICKRCNVALSELVDHIVPAGEAIRQAQASGKWRGPYAGFFFKSNLQGLCRSCHKLKTDEDKQHVASGEPWPDIVAKELAAPKKKWSF